MKTLLLFLLLTFNSLFAQNSLDAEIKSNRSALTDIKQQIKSLRNDLAKTDIKTSSTLQQIENIEKEMALISKSKHLLLREINLLNKKIAQTRNELEENRSKLKNLQDHYVKRAVSIYKRGKVQNIELLLGAESFNQALIRYKYLKYFSEQEKRIINKIKAKIEQISYLEQNLAETIQDQTKSLHEKKAEHLNYLAKKDQKKVFIKQLKWTSINLNKRLKDAQYDYNNLYQLVVNLEKQRKIREQKGDQTEIYTLNLKNFKKNKGKLPWPVEGRIIHKYGKQKDRVLKTTINNTGIDIQAKSGDEVRAIFTGLVSMITYLSGFGNTIILDHGEGYYSVYSHLDEIFVDRDDLVEAGGVIGLVGDSGSLEGSKLHFAVFSNQKTENPQTWLK